VQCRQLDPRDIVAQRPADGRSIGDSRNTVAMVLLCTIENVRVLAWVLGVSTLRTPGSCQSSRSVVTFHRTYLHLFVTYGNGADDQHRSHTSPVSGRTFREEAKRGRE
jgi:hypothetical protein